METKLFFILLNLFIAVNGDSVLTDESNPVVGQFLKGNPQLCNRLPLFPVLPGSGWDNLRNKEMDLVVEHNYSRCSTTDDARFLIPDSIFTIPIKSSSVETSAELIDHWDNYTSTVSSSINVDSSIGFAGFKIGGKFSSEYSSVKEKQYNEKTVTARTQARFLLYQARLNRDVSLSPNFRSRVRKIGFYVTLNKLDLARYESQLLVRDYGTHVITNMDVGAVIVKVDQIKESYVGQSTTTKQSATASASASFFGKFSFGADFSSSTQTSSSSLQAYLSHLVTSDIQSIGGTSFKPVNFSVNHWIDSIKDDMVAIDVDGDPLTFFINQETLPDMPVRTIVQVQNFVTEAIACYYKHNTYQGCTDPRAPNFNFQANLNDGACETPLTNFTFGGVFQNCSSSGYTNLCVDMAHRNPLTGEFTCPRDYSAVILNSGSKRSSTTQQNCRSCGFLWLSTCCDTTTLTAYASYSAYWCAANGPVGMNQGFLFGGTFTSKVVNPLTQRNSCPQRFYGINVLQDLTVCVSDDYELAGSTALPFAGFFSCRAGNPLAISEELGLLQQTKHNLALISFIQSSGVSSYPKKCPKDYSQHLVVVDSGCEINYCAKAGVFSAKGLVAVQRPPFMSFPAYETNDLDPDKIKIEGHGKAWVTMDKEAALSASNDRMPSDVTGSGSKSDSGGGMSAPGAGALGAIVAVVVFAGACLIVFLIRRKKAAVVTGLGVPYDSMRDVSG